MKQKINSKSFLTRLRGLTVTLVVLFSLSTGNAWGASATWVLVESEPSDWSGEYLIVYNNNCFDGSLTSGFNGNAGQSVSISNKQITKDDSYSLTVSKVSGKYYLRTASGYYIGRKANSNGVDANTSRTTDYVVTFSSWNGTNKTVKIAGTGGRCLGNNSGSWKFFSSGNTYVNVSLYKKSAAASHTLSSAVSPAGYGTVALSATSVVEGSTATATATANTGYVFSSWSISGTGASLSSTTDNPTTVTMGTANATVTANFAAKTAASISFVNAGPPAPTTSGYYVGDSYTLPSTNNYSCNGKTFVGWSTVPVAETDIKPTSNFYEPGASATLAASQTFYAVFASVTEGTGDWEQCSSSTIADGDYLIVQSDYMMTNTLNSQRFNKTSIAISAGVISYDAKADWSAYTWHIAETSTSGIFTIKNGNKYVIGTGTASKIDLVSTPADDKELFAITYQSTPGTYKIVSKYNEAASVNRWLRYGGTYFACYADGGYPYLFKRGNGYGNYCTTCAVTHTVSSAVDPTGKATVTLGATTVAEGGTTTATHSAITTGYEFVNWSISGTGATLSSTTSNPTTITMGTANVTVTANLRCITPTFSAHPNNVTCNQNASTTLSVTAAAGGASLSYQWMQCATSGGTYVNVTGGSGGTTRTYTPPTTSLGTMYYKCKVTNVASGCSANATSNAASVTVKGTVTYDANGGTGTMTDASSPYTSGATVTVKSNTFTAPEGKQFDHWNTAANNSGATYAAGATFSMSGNTTLYAQWACITPSISVQPSGATYTKDDTPTNLSVTASGGTLSYQWKQCATIDGVYSNVASGGTSSTYSPSTASVGTIYYKCVVTNTGSSCNTTVTSDAAAITVNAASYFTNGATVFIQTGSVSSAWDDNSCVKAWFNASGAGGAAQTTYWLYDGTGDNNGKKLFATIVPASGDLNQVTLQRFASNCSDFWNNNGTLTKASDGGSNTFRTEGPGTSAVAWNNDGIALSLYGDPNSWGSSLATFADQGNGVWTATYSNYTPSVTSADFKIYTSYADWIGNTGSNNNATLSGMIVGSKYNVTATLDVKDHSLVMSKTFVSGTVHFNLQGHGSAIADLTNVAAGSKISAPSAPSETGWTFGGWYKEPACTNAWNFASDVVNETMTLYAKWTIKTTTVSFNQNGGSGGQTSSKTATYGSAMPTPITCPTRTGYDFGGYYDGAGGTGTQYYTNAGASARTWNKEDATWTLYAKWTAKEYSVTLDREGASTGSESVTMTYNSASHTAITAPSKTGYTFGGWYTGDDGTGTQVMNASGTLQVNVSGYTGAGGVWTKTTTPTTLYAKWTANPYTVTLNDGSGSGGDGTVPVTYNSNTNISDVTKPTYAGNDFRGYFTSAGGAGTKVINGNGEWITNTAYVDASGKWIFDGSPILYAHYTATTYENYRTSCSTTAKTITIIDVTHGTVTTSPSGNAEPDDVVTITLTPDAHYNAGGAPTVEDENGDPVAVSGSGTTYTFTMPDADVTITPAAWSPINVTIYWHRKTGTTPEAVLEGTTGKTFPNTTDVDAECAPFLGWIAGTVWSDSPDAPAEYYEYGDDMPGPINADVHYTAIYGEIEMHETTAYVKVTSAPSNWSGDYLIVRDDNSRAFDGSLSTLDAADNYIGVTISAGTITANNTVNASKWTIAKVGETSNYTIKSASGYYIGRTSNSNGLNSSTSEEYTNTLAYSTDHVVITSSGGPTLQMYGGTRFRYYGTSQQVLQLYKLGIAEVPTTTYTKNPACTPKYHVTVNSATGGSPSSDKTLEPEGETITLTANPGAGYAFTEWAMENSSTHADATSLLSNSTAATATFSMPAYDVTVTATYAKKMVTELKVMDDETVVANTTGPVSGTLNVSTGANKTLDVAITPGDAFDHSWTASVTAGGTYASITNVNASAGTFQVNGLAAGDATVTVNAPNDGTAKTVTFTVHVTDILPEEIILKRDGSNTPIESLTMYYDAANSRGQYVKVNVSYSPTPTNKEFTFSSAATGKVGSHSHAAVAGYEVLVAKGVTTEPVNCTFTSSADGSVTKVLAVTVLPCPTDQFVDYIHGNATITRSAQVSADQWSINTDITAPTLSDAAESASADCVTGHYHLIGWLPQATAEALLAAGTPITSSTEGLIAAGATIEASGQTWCAIWAKKE